MSRAIKNNCEKGGEWRFAKGLCSLSGGKFLGSNEVHIVDPGCVIDLTKKVRTVR